MTALNIHVLAAVIDPGNPGGYREGFAADVARGITMPEKAGWPSVGHYSLTEMQGARLLAAGRHSVYYNRSALERQRALYRETAEKLAA